MNKRTPRRFGLDDIDRYTIILITPANGVGSEGVSGQKYANPFCPYGILGQRSPNKEGTKCGTRASVRLVTTFRLLAFGPPASLSTWRMNETPVPY
jgi:hypothetical protein